MLWYKARESNFRGWSIHTQFIISYRLNVLLPKDLPHQRTCLENAEVSFAIPVENMYDYMDFIHHNGDHVECINISKWWYWYNSGSWNPPPLPE